MTGGLSSLPHSSTASSSAMIASSSSSQAVPPTVRAACWGTTTDKTTPAGPTLDTVTSCSHTKLLPGGWPDDNENDALCRPDAGNTPCVTLWVVYEPRKDREPCSASWTL